MVGLDTSPLEDPENHPDDETLLTLSPDEQAVVLIAWFQHNFEDPAHSTPYESAEGGYQYIWGGPYDAREQLQDRFPELPEEVIEEAVSAVEVEAVDWAPSDTRIRAVEDDEPQEPPLDQEAWRARVTSELDELQNALGKALGHSRGGIGHNRPPEPIEDDETAPLSKRDADEIQLIIDKTRSDVEASGRDLEPKLLKSRSERLNEISKKILSWIGKRLNALIDKAAGPGIIYAYDHYQELAEKTVSVAHTLSDWAASMAHTLF